ncbi:hypothetical protein ACFYO0_42830 [Streptomyces sp. NPDC006365]|uniref:hypothetical protein n=1 Tax=Streptomyces sp. NPDC006365 TaxID=3364744 RepID=UPI00369C35F2
MLWPVTRFPAPLKGRLNAYEDQCAPANPRTPMLDDLQQLMQAAYFGPDGTPGE